MACACSSSHSTYSSALSLSILLSTTNLELSSPAHHRRCSVSGKGSRLQSGRGWLHKFVLCLCVLFPTGVALKSKMKLRSVFVLCATLQPSIFFLSTSSSAYYHCLDGRLRLSGIYLSASLPVATLPDNRSISRCRIEQSLSTELRNTPTYTHAASPARNHSIRVDLLNNLI